METSRALMPLLTELGRLGEGFGYKHVAPNGASAPQREFSTEVDDPSPLPLQKRGDRVAADQGSAPWRAFLFCFWTRLNERALLRT